MHSDLKLVFNNLLSKKQKLYYVISLFFSILLSFLELLAIGLLTLYVGIIFQKNFFLEKIDNDFFSNFINEYSTLETTIYLGTLIFFFFLIKNLLLAMINYRLKIFYNSLLVDNAKKLFNKYIYANLKFFLIKNPSMMLRNLSIEIKKSCSILDNINLIFKEGFLVILIILAISLNHPLLSLIIFVSLISISTFIFFLIKNRIQHLSKNSVLFNSKIIQTINQSIGAIKDIKISNNHNYFEKQFSNFFHQGIESAFLINFLSSLPRLVIEVLSVGAILLIIIFSVYFLGNTDDLFFLMSFIVLSVIRLLPAFNTITSSLTMLKSNRVSFDEIYSDVKLINLLEKKNNLNFKEEITFLNFKKIKFENLSFDYKEENRKKNIIKDLNYSILENDCVGILGPSGAGKSTLVNLFSGLLFPDNGKITIDGVNMMDNLKAWQKIIGYIPQNIYLIDDDIRKNIAFGIDENEIDEKKIQHVIKLSKLESLINSLKDKEKTLVGHRGVRFSGGQIQRIGIARALYRNPKILIMDEATSALDIETEDKIIDEINSLKGFKVKIIISHRKNTIKNCNKVLNLDIK